MSETELEARIASLEAEIVRTKEALRSRAATKQGRRCIFQTLMMYALTKRLW
jgi:uncharacterized small protein (DUF1192 family)